MATNKTIQVSFGGGEVSPFMFGRIDDSKRLQGLETCRNFICTPQGPVSNRPGFQYVNTVGDSTHAVRLIKFGYNTDQMMAIELGHKYARFHARGQTIMGDNGQPYQITTPWEADDLFDLTYVQAGDVITICHKNYAPRELRRYGNTDWRIAQVSFAPKLGVPSNVSAVRATAAAEDENADKYTFKYRVSALNADKTVESEPSEIVSVVANLYAYGTTVKVSWNAVEGATFYRVYKCQGGLYGYIGDTEDLEIIDDDIDPNMDVTPRRYDDVLTEPKGISSVTVTNGGSGYLQFERGVAPIVFTDDMRISQSVSSRYEYPAYPTVTASIVDLAGSGSGATVQVFYDQERYKDKHIESGDSGDEYWVYYSRATISNIKITNPGRNYEKPILRIKYNFWFSDRTKEFNLSIQDQGVVLDVTDPTGTGAELKAIVTNGAITGVSVVRGGKDYTNPTIKAISDTGSGATFTATISQTGNNPRCVGYFEQRKCFAGFVNDPQRVIMTSSGTEDNMTYSLPSQDTDSINFKIAAREYNEILHIVPLSQLLLLTTGGEMRVSPLNSDAITPSSIAARPQSYVGASAVQPVIVNNNVLYCSAKGGHIREFSYKYEAGGFVSGDLCLRSAHLFDEYEIKDMCFSQAPTPILWCVRNDGSLLGLTYIPEQSIGAWHHHDTDGTFESCVAVTEDGEDRLYAVIGRRVNGVYKRYIERMASCRTIYSSTEACFLDSSGEYQGDPTDTITGLAWLEGKTVVAVGDGAVMPETTVTNGTIKLQAPCSRVYVGLPYECDVRTLPAAINNGAYGMGTNRNVSRIAIRVFESSGIFAGPSFDKLTEYKQRTTESPGSPPELKTGEILLQLKGVWANDGSVCVRQTDPLPLTLVSLALDVQT